MAENFDLWFKGAPVVQTGATGDFSVWKDGAPVLQLQAAAVVVEIVGAGGVEVGGAALVEVVVVPELEGVDPGGRRPVGRRARLCPVAGEPCWDVSCVLPATCVRERLARDPRARDFVFVGSGGVEIGGDDTVIAVRTRRSRRREEEELLLLGLL